MLFTLPNTCERIPKPMTAQCFQITYSEINFDFYEIYFQNL